MLKEVRIWNFTLFGRTIQLEPTCGKMFGNVDCAALYSSVMDAKWYA